jgi:enoyl-CoA hydratase
MASAPASTDQPSVRVERSGPVTTIILDRAHARNAVNKPTAHALANAFRDFENDKDAKVAVLYGAGGNFCAGADLKAASTGIGMNEILPVEDGNDGPMVCTVDRSAVL